MTYCTKKNDVLLKEKKGENIFADMAESADALDSGSSEGNFVEVQVLLSAPNHSNPNRSRQIFAVGDCFGFVLYLDGK